MPEKRKKDPWAQRIGESMAAYSLFLVYLQLGPQARKTQTEGYEAVAEESGRHIEVVRKVASYNAWPSRARAYDERLAEVQLKAAEKALEKDAVLRAKKRSQYLEEEFDVAKKLLSQAKQMLEAPLYETTVDRIETIETAEGSKEFATAVTMKPANWNKDTASRYAKMASDIMRLNLEMDTARTSINVNFDVNDPDARLKRAKAALAKQREVEVLERSVQAAMLQNPEVNPEELRTQILQELPKWISEYWNVDQSLLEDNPVDPLMADVDNSASDFYVC